ncbi:hypothetical protein ACFFRR_005230 [Megaselia abdita]
MACFCEMIGVACFLAFVLSLSSKAPYQLKMGMFGLVSGIIVLISLPFMLLRPKDHRNALFPAAGCRILGRMLGVTMEVRGLENVDVTHGSVVLMNHQSLLDLCALAYLWPVIGKGTVVSKREILYIPFFGFGAWLWGTLFINRSRKSDSINCLNKESRALKERQCKLMLFPEGTRNTKDTLLPFKKGSFHIAIGSQSPIQPVVISKYYFLDSEKKKFKNGCVIINILPEISTLNTTTENMNEVIDKTRQIMQTEFTKLSNEVIQNFKTD